MTMSAHFTFGEQRRIDKVLSVMKDLAENDEYFARAVEQFETADDSDKIVMCKYMLEIYNETDFEYMTLEQAVLLRAYR